LRVPQTLSLWHVEFPQSTSQVHALLVLVFCINRTKNENQKGLATESNQDEDTMAGCDKIKPW
jgi:hypothetical protein